MVKKNNGKKSTTTKSLNALLLHTIFFLLAKVQ